MSMCLNMWLLRQTTDAGARSALLRGGACWRPVPRCRVTRWPPSLRLC